VSTSVRVQAKPRAGRPGFSSRQGQLWDFLSSPLSDRLWGPQNFLSNRYRELKGSGREADQSSPFSAEVKNTRIYTTTTPIRIHGAVFR
jgi:hypothetical protein